jgi:hypothetical protein
MDVSGLFVTMYYGSNEALADEAVTMRSSDIPGTAFDDRYVVVHLTDAAGRDETDAAGDLNGNGVVRQVGIKNEAEIWTITNSMVTLGNISNFLPGTANLTGNISGLTVYNQAMLPQITITNNTDRSLTLGNVIFRNEGFVNPRVYKDGSRYSVNILNTHYAPELTVTNTGAGDITLNGMIPPARRACARCGPTAWWCGTPPRWAMTRRIPSTPGSCPPTPNGIPTT